MEGSINSIPVEILPNIFKFLLLGDRKHVRLTCRLWYNACNCSEVVKNEKFVFRQGHGLCDDFGPTADIVQDSFLHCKILRDSIEFHELSLFGLKSEFWKHCGTQLRSVFINNSDATCLEHIILYCINLTHLHIQLYRNKYARFEETLDKLIQQGIERKNLISLKLFLDSRSCVGLIQKMVQIYPCIKTLGQGFWPSISSIKGQIWRETTPKEWVLPPMIENFSSTTVSTLNSWKSCPFKFKEFETIIDFQRNIELDVLLGFFDCQTEIETLRLAIWQGKPEETKILLFHILLNLSKLKHLHFCFTDTDFSFTIMEFSDFLKNICHLETLVLHFEPSIHSQIRRLPARYIPSIVSQNQRFTGLQLDSQCSSMKSSLPATYYTALKNLQLTNVDERISFEILTRCSTSLKSLLLKPASVNNEVIQKIVKTHVELQTLQILDGDFSFMYAPSTGTMLSRNNYSSTEKYLFGKLPNLFHLEIVGLPLDLVDMFLLGFDFPNLKYFHFEVSFPYGNDYKELYCKQRLEVLDKVMNTISMKAPLLEILEIHLFDRAVFRFQERDILSAFIHYCKRMKYLQFIVDDSCIILNNRLLPNLFFACPSLKCIDPGRACFKIMMGQSSFYNRSTKHLFYTYSEKGLYHKHYITND